ncbi:MAG: hypothetical protein OEW15_09275 [Nitrospirota bacterium]|nr:hypothetical protein [Nitrospirota bacterium]
MNITLTSQDYLDLLDILHIADIVMSGNRRTEDARTERQRALVQKLYGLSRVEGLGHLMSYDETAKRNIPTKAFEENSVAHKVMHEFSDHLFWNDLISRLSFRDAALIAGGAEQLNAMSDEERQRTEGPIRQRYIAEFTRNGIRNLEVVERFGDTDAGPVRTSD